MFLSFCVLNDFFRFSKKSGFGVFLVHPTVISVLLSASVERCFVSRMRDFIVGDSKSLNLKEHQNHITGLRVAAIFLNW